MTELGAATSTAIRFARSDMLESSCSWLAAGFSYRSGGCSLAPFNSLNLGLHVGDDPAMVTANRRQFARTLLAGDTLLDRWVVPEQVHGAGIVEVSPADRGSGASLSSAIPGADGLVTSSPLVPLLLMFADCVPVAIVDPASRTVCLVHAGWRGAVAGIAARGIEWLCRERRAVPQRLMVWIAPSIGKCCYQVGPEVAEALRRGEGSAIVEPDIQSQGRFRVDLKAVIAGQLARVGVMEQRIEVDDECTCCSEDRYFSYRRDLRTGRMGLGACILD